MAGNPIILKITGIQDDNGQMAVSVEGPIDNQLLCYGLLEITKDLIKERHKPRIMPVTGHIPPRIS